MTTVNKSKLVSEIKKINNIQKFSSLTQKELNNGFNIIMRAKVQLMLELETPQSESELFGVFEKVSKSCKIYNESDINNICDYIINNSDKDFLNNILELLN